MKYIFKTLGFLRLALYANLYTVHLIKPTLNKERFFQGETIHILR